MTQMRLLLVFILVGVTVATAAADGFSSWRRTNSRSVSYRWQAVGTGSTSCYLEYRDDDVDARRVDAVDVLVRVDYDSADGTSHSDRHGTRINNTPGNEFINGICSRVTDVTVLDRRELR